MHTGVSIAKTRVSTATAEGQWTAIFAATFVGERKRVIGNFSGDLYARISGPEVT